MSNRRHRTWDDLRGAAVRCPHLQRVVKLVERGLDPETVLIDAAVRMSADLASLRGRMAAAAARGEA